MAAWEWDRLTRLLALRARVKAMRDRWYRERRGSADPEVRARVGRHLKALGRRAHRLAIEVNRARRVEGAGDDPAEVESLPREATVAEVTYPYVWRVKTALPDRFGTACRIAERLNHTQVRIEFEDGATKTAPRTAVRLRQTRGASRG